MVNEKLIFDVPDTNTVMPVNSNVDNKKSLSKTNLFERRPQKDAQLLFIGWKISKNITIVQLNINLLRNKLGAMEDLIKKYSKTPLIRPS